MVRPRRTPGKSADAPPLTDERTATIDQPAAMLGLSGVTSEVAHRSRRGTSLASSSASLMPGWRTHSGARWPSDAESGRRIRSGGIRSGARLLDIGFADQAEALPIDYVLGAAARRPMSPLSLCAAASSGRPVPAFHEHPYERMFALGGVAVQRCRFARRTPSAGSTGQGSGQSLGRVDGVIPR